MSALDRLLGHVALHPGRRPAIVATRPELAPTLLRGLPVHAVPARAAAVFTLCSAAHRVAAQAALAAAGAGAPPSPAQARSALFAATAREHALRLCHDWPRAWAPGAAAAGAAALAASAPVWAAGLDDAARAAALDAWLAQRVLGEDAERWRERAAGDASADTPAAWCARAATPTAAALAAVRSRAQALPTPAGRPLALSALPEIGERLGRESGWSMRPRLAGGVPDTGCWSRAADAAADRTDAPRSAWERIAARLVDLVRLAADPSRLAHGASSPAPGVGLAWAETARGLLVHRVAVEPTAGGLVVADYRVVAPTEWNFHPDGVLAGALAALAPDDAAAARLLAAAFDPCVPLRTPAAEMEVRDA